MGANQSSAGDGGGDGGEEGIKTSYYELLGVERQASEDDIKKAYRKKALELHPDRNYGKEDEATRLFAEIQTAYQVLSDPQERAWYDSHEAAILRGGAAGEDHFEYDVRVTTADDITSMIAKFHGRVDYSDSPDGFYGFLRDKFERLAKEEQLAVDVDDVDLPDYPSFGHKDDTFEDVVKEFYAAWAGFSTKKSFAWKDIYKTSEAPDRRNRRAMEKENKKLRDEGIREFNDIVRTLIAFVRKRDPRYTPNTQTDAERQKALQKAREVQAAKARAANAVKVTEDAVPEWARHRDLGELEESEEEEAEEEHFECVACNKVFKSEKQFDTHEKSKKHQKAVYALRRKMQKDEQRLGLEEDDLVESGFASPVEGGDEHGDDGNPIPEVESLNVDDVDSKDNADSGSATAGNQPPIESEDSDESKEEDADTDDDYAPRADIAARLASPDTSIANDSEGFEKDGLEDGRPSGKKVGKAAQKRAKKAAKLAATNAEDLRFRCAKCNSAFPSRTQLFQHIKDFGHAALKSETVRGGKGKRK